MMRPEDQPTADPRSSRRGLLRSGGATTTVRSSGKATVDVQHRGEGDGLVASTGDSMGAAIRAVNTNDEQLMGVGGAVVATGEGCAAVIATSYAGHDAAIYAYGFTDETETDRKSALYAIGSVYLSGPVYIDGDLTVAGTIYCDDVRPLDEKQRAEVRRRAALPRPAAG
jgi:hypothetical protein